VTRVGDEEGTIEGEKGVLDLLLGGLVDVLLEVRDDGLGESLTEGVDLRGLTTALDAEPDVDTSETIATEDQDCDEKKKGKRQVRAKSKEDKPPCLG
jgi:hypothetical protein